MKTAVGKVPRAVFGLHTVCDPECQRYALGGVYFERGPDGNPVAVAADGKRLLAVSWMGADQRGDGTAIVPKAVCRQVEGELPAIVKNRKTTVAVSMGASGEGPHRLAIDLAANGRSMAISTESLDGKFPKWRDVVPRYTPEDSISVMLDPHLLAEMLVAMAGFLSGDSDEMVPGVVLTLPKASAHDRPILFSGARRDGHKAVGVIMPLSNGHPSPPAWIPEASPPATAPKPQPKKRAAKKAKK